MIKITFDSQPTLLGGDASLAEWLKAREGKITGSRIKDLGKYSKGKNKGELKTESLKLIAEWLREPTYQDPYLTMSAKDRGNALEEEAIVTYRHVLKLTINNEKCLWVREDNDMIAVSPDGSYKTKTGKLRGVESKSLGDAEHIKAIMKNAIPDEYRKQVIQYMVVCDEMVGVDFILYNPRLKSPYNLHVIRIERVDVLEEIEAQRKEEEQHIVDAQNVMATL